MQGRLPPPSLKPHSFPSADCSSGLAFVATTALTPCCSSSTEAQAKRNGRKPNCISHGRKSSRLCNGTSAVPATLSAAMAQTRPTSRLTASPKDGVELAEYLCHQLGKKKIIVLDHSWGSIVATHMVQMRPDSSPPTLVPAR